MSDVKKPSNKGVYLFIFLVALGGFLIVEVILNFYFSSKEKNASTSVTITLSESTKEATMAAIELKVGDKAPAFELQNQDEKEISLTDYKGKWLILYFYPKDNTPGCTTEAVEFTSHIAKFGKKNSVVVGVSPDSCDSHVKFIDKYDLKVELLSDTSKKMLEAYGVWQLKKNYGKEYMGVVRTTILINPEGKIAHIWNNVKAAGHAEAVLEKLNEISGS